MDYQRITETHAADLRLPNDTFELFGRMIVSRIEEEWQYRTVFLIPLKRWFFRMRITRIKK